MVQRLEGGFVFDVRDFSGLPISRRSSDSRRSAMIASIVDFPLVKPDCCERRVFVNSGLSLLNKMWAITFPGTGRRAIGR